MASEFDPTGFSNTLPDFLAAGRYAVSIPSVLWLLFVLKIQDLYIGSGYTTHQFGLVRF